MMTRDELCMGQYLLNNSGIVVQVIQIDYQKRLFITRDPQEPSETDCAWSINDAGQYFRLLPSDIDFYKELVKL